MKLLNVLDLSKRAMIAIVGAGGKTTLLMKLASEIRNQDKVLITTTTKIYCPDKELYDAIALDNEKLDQLKKSKQNGLYVLGNGINHEGKLCGVNPYDLQTNLDDFHYIIVEADGAKRKPLKGWKTNEPVIPEGTTMTIGVLSIKVIGLLVNSANVHRMKEFITITKAKENTPITTPHILKLLFHKKGLFNKALGKKVLFINQVESKVDYNLACDLINKINILNKEQCLIDRIIFGSLHQGDYYA